MRFSEDQIKAREKLWRAAVDKTSLELTEQEVRDLWGSILDHSVSQNRVHEAAEAFIATTKAHGTSGNRSFSQQSSPAAARLADALTES